ncbi:MAG: hypothetical protein GC203_01725 [Phenylobacterium sp.]|uniref:hypothetical protein n=1 Tax=Phenylobacterium sp. TaxID=1871053 RepID=UPI0025EA7892|nr:hypothetical protein [Phenylobacterium sp.]MBI1196564.1 hypothetical protein [Phenylobacterium sp.]
MTSNLNCPRRLVRLVVAAALAAAGLVAPTPSFAQLPPHPPGSICLTPYLWCWMPQPGPVNQSCVCYTPRGPIGGRTV